MRPKLCIAALVAVIFIVAGCGRTERDAYDLRVSAYDGKTKQWTLVDKHPENNQLNCREIHLECESYQWAEKPMVRGEDACNLPVGMDIARVTDLSKPLDAPRLDILDNNTAAIQEGKGDDKIVQLFRILKDKIVDHCE